MTLRIATRGSELALWQARHVATLLGGECDLVVVDTSADRRLDVQIWELGGKGAFVKEVQAAVLDGRADLAVHSAKDLPSVTHPALRLAAVPARADARDALVGAPLADLPPGARVATGSNRRRVQLADLRPDLTFTGLRGNIATRLARLDTDHDVDAVVVAAAALDRLGLAEVAAELLDPEVVVPQVGQGALAVECRADDSGTAATLAAIQDATARREVDAERGFLVELGGDCDLPAGAHSVVREDGSIRLDAVLAPGDGHTVLRHRVEGAADEDPAVVGARAARTLLGAGGA